MANQAPAVQVNGVNEKSLAAAEKAICNILRAGGAARSEQSTIQEALRTLACLELGGQAHLRDCHFAMGDQNTGAVTIP